MLISYNNTAVLLYIYTHLIQQFTKHKYHPLNLFYVINSMSHYNCRHLIYLTVLFLLVMVVSGRSNVSGKQNKTGEEQFMKWVKFVGKLKHSVFKSAKNKLFPSYTLTVDKNPAMGDFTSIQDAIDSLPAVNLVRVVISVHAGVYKSVSLSSSLSSQLRSLQS